MLDAIIIGGGILGQSVGYHLAKSGARVVVVDRRDEGRATDAGAGIITPGGDPNSRNPWSRLVGEAEAYYPALVHALERDGMEDTGYSVCGALTVAVSAAEKPAFAEASEGIPRGEGRDGEGPVVVEGDRARELFPALDAVEGALYAPTGARVDGRRLAAALQTAGEEHGLDVRIASADRIEVESGRVTAVVVNGERLEAGHVVIAGGAWSNTFGEQLGVRLPVGPMRGQIAHLDLGETDTSDWTIVSGFRGHYLVPWDDNRVVAGATREMDAGYQVGTTVEGILEVLSEAIRVAPGLRGASVKEFRVGLRPATSDGFPIIGAIPNAPNVHVVTGHGPMGLHLGPYSGKVVADTILGHDDATGGAFGVERFA
jgi:D-amino-acid dehydrogenase